MLILKRNLVVGFMLCIMIFSFVVPFLFGLRTIPETLSGSEDVVVILQKDHYNAINSTLVEALAESENITTISPEILFPSIVSGEPLLCKGVEGQDILELDSLTLRGEWMGDNNCVIGRDAARRLGVDIGDTLAISSPNKPSFVFLTVSGVFHSDKPSDSLLIHVDHARFLMSMDNGTYTIIRLLTDNLEEVQHIVDTAGTGITNIEFPPEPLPDEGEEPGEEEPGEEESDEEIEYAPPVVNPRPDAAIRLGRRYVNFFSVSGSSGGYASAAITYGHQTVDIVVISLLVMTIFLVVAGATVLVLRGIAEGRKDMGVLVAIGAPRRTIRLLFFRDIAVITLMAAPLGILLGVALSQIVSALFPIVAFGHTITPAPMATVIWALAGGCLIIPVLAWLLGGESTTSEHPRNLFAPMDLETPHTPLDTVLEGGEI